MVLGSLRTSPYLLDGVQPFMADDVFCSCGGAYLDGGQYARFLGRSGGGASSLWRRGCVQCSAGGLLEFRVERRFRKLDLMGFVFVILAIDAVLLTRMGIKRNRLAALGGFTPFVMLVAASLAVFETTGVSSAIFVSIFTAFLAVAVIGRGYRSDSNLLKWVGGCLLAAAGAVRVLDAALSFGQRGIFFLVIGAAAIIVCCLTFLPHAVKKIRRKPGRKTVRRDRQPAAPADQSALLSDLTETGPERKTEEGGERRE